jgi:hypothetical protein
LFTSFLPGHADPGTTGFAGRGYRGGLQFNNSR